LGHKFKVSRGVTSFMAALIFLGLSYLLFVIAMGLTRWAWAEVEIENEGLDRDDSASHAPCKRALLDWLVPTRWRSIGRIGEDAVRA
jgi:hypothetical protein